MSKINTFYKIYFLFCCLTLSSGVSQAQNNVILFEENGNIGLQDSEEKVIIRAQYEKLGWSDGLNIPVGETIGYFDDAWGLISLKDKRITAPKFYSLKAVHRDLMIASVKGKFSNELLYGVINNKGEVRISFKYHSLKPLRELLIVSERRDNQAYFGLLNQAGREILPLIYRDISYFNNDLFVFTDSFGLKGVIHESGIMKIEATLDSIASPIQGLSKVYSSGKVGLIDSLGIIIHPPKYKSVNGINDTTTFTPHRLYDAVHNLVQSMDCDSVSTLSDDLLAIHCNGFSVIVDHQFNTIYRSEGLQALTAFRKNISFKKNGVFHLIKSTGIEVNADKGYDTLLYDGQYIYGQTGSKWKVYNRFGTDISQWAFDSVVMHSNNLIPIKKNKHWGYLDHAGKIAISVKYDQAGPFTGSIARVNYLGDWYIINQFGEPLNNHPFDEIFIEKNNMAFVKSKSRIDMIDNKGKVYFQTFNTLTPHPFGFLERTEEHKTGMVSHFGEVLLDPIYDSISLPINRKYLAVRNGNETGLINMHGFWILPMSTKYQEIGHVSDGMIGIKKNGQYGFIDFGKKLLIANRYEGIQSFSENRAAVQLNGKWGFIDKKETLIIQPSFDSVANFYHKMTIVKRDGKYGAINQAGQFVVSLSYDHISTTNMGFLLVTKNGKLGLYNDHGEMLHQTSYTGILATKDGNFIVNRRNLMGVIEASGRYAIPLKFSSVIQLADGMYLCKMP